MGVEYKWILTIARPSLMASYEPHSLKTDNERELLFKWETDRKDCVKSK